MTSVIIGINYLIDYGEKKQLISAEDKPYIANALFHLLEIPPQMITKVDSSGLKLDAIFEMLLTEQVLEKKGIRYGFEKEALRAKVMDLFALNPSQVSEKFLSEMLSPQERLAEFYQYCQSIDYIKLSNRFVKWDVESQYGTLEITINFSKPEKDPKEIAKLAEMKENTNYPRCPLCLENVGYYGDSKHAARSNLRVLPLTLQEEAWSFQFSPYSYYNEHAIVLKNHHQPMKITETTFKRLIEFVELYPHYFIGSNAGLPIVGGSILDHDHYQAGAYEFTMMRAESLRIWHTKNVSVELLNWPLSVVRIKSTYPDELVKVMTLFTKKWETYTCDEYQIYAETTMGEHHAVTPIIRKNGEYYEGYLAFRSNRTSDEYPEGIYHPHPEIHPIKKENIGLIEVMGYAILPSRLQQELREIEKCLIEATSWPAAIEKHRTWVESLFQNEDISQEMIMDMLQQEAGEIFIRGLEHANVFQNSAHAIGFIEEVLNS